MKHRWNSLISHHVLPKLGAHQTRMQAGFLLALTLSIGNFGTLSHSVLAAEPSADSKNRAIPATDAIALPAVVTQSIYNKAKLQEPSLEMLELPTNVAPEMPGNGVSAQASIGTPQGPLKARAVVVDINSRTLDYDKIRDVYIATGSAHVVISEQNSELIADKVTYDQKRNFLVAEGHVVIIKNGQRTEGTYAKIDLTRESALINDPNTVLKAVRVKAEKSLVNSRYVELEDGKLIVSGQYLATMMANNQGQFVNTGNGRNSYSRLSNRANVAAQKSQNVQTEDPINLPPPEDDPKRNSKFNLHVREITVKRSKDGYNDVDLKWPSLYYGKFKVATMPSNDFMFNQSTKEFEYLGPDIGFNQNLGGFYAGPGWDFKAGSGVVRFSPLVSYGKSGIGNVSKSNDKNVDEAGPSIGGLLHYRDPKTILDVGYNPRVGYPVVFGQRQLFSENTHFMIASHDFYQNGLLQGQTERPNYIAQVTDYRVLGTFKNFQLTSFESIGAAQDNFFPNNRTKQFVSPTAAEEQTAGRLQLQAQFRNIRPLLQMGKVANVGFNAQAAFHGYTTGDAFGLLRAGPVLNVNLANRFYSSLNYFLAGTTGQSPFVFDTYLGGSQNVILNNQFRVNDYLTVGTMNNLNLKKDNAQNALAVGNQVYMLVGPKDVKLNLAFDVISRRTSFGINFYPGSGNNVVNFDKMKIYQPQDYTGQPQRLPQAATQNLAQ